MFPALFITDLSVPPGNTNPLAGDWQFGGTGIPPTEVFGTWKAATATINQVTNTVTVTPDNDSPTNNWNLGTCGPPDPVPTPTPTNEGYGTEVRWDISALGLIPGHQYRLYFMVHDGDQNQTGGDSGQGCAYITMPGTPPPTPTASPTPTATATATATFTPTPTPTPTPQTVIVTNKTFGGGGMAAKTVTVTFRNNTAVAQVLTGLAMTWPQATNGNLKSITMGATTIFNTSTGGGSLNTSSLLGTNAQRTINANGGTATLTITFNNNVDTTNTHYTGSATFNPFGSVTMLP
jgi:hypothetical protein